MAFTAKQKVIMFQKICLAHTKNSIEIVPLFCSTVDVLLAFFENRLKDHYVVTPPVLHGLRALVSVQMQSIFIAGTVLHKQN